ncbi:hypothetical protein [Mesomycoplasma neurolyticum]|uniref:hypothetical protein n=1 Tax=Mesomycoplasma neurolyticum TaxID=2120 RepID=UPI00101D4EFC|nr:hypothetical protein [Mesomycoplasma neurolyticum]
MQNLETQNYKTFENNVLVYLDALSKEKQKQIKKEYVQSLQQLQKFSFDEAKKIIFKQNINHKIIILIFKMMKMIDIFIDIGGTK